MSAPLLGDSFAQTSQNLKYDLQQFANECRKCAAHKSKFIRLSTNIKEFLKNFKVTDDASRIVSPTESDLFKLISGKIKEIRALLAQYTGQIFLKSVMTSHPKDILEVFVSFRKEFDNVMTELKLTEFNPLTNLEQLHIDDNEDVKQLKVWIKQSNFSDTEKKVKLQEVEDYIENIKTNVEDDAVLTEEDIKTALKEYSEYFIDTKDFVLQKSIGEGGFATVYSGYQSSTLKTVAIKVLKVKTFTQKDLEIYVREISMLGSLHHFALLPLVGFSTKAPYYIITDLMPGGSLRDRLNNIQEHPIDPSKKTIIALGVAYGMAYMHSKNMIHRDLKAQNILLDADDYPRIADFGLSRFLSENDGPMTSQAGTIAWCSPEMLMSDHYDQKIDVYSYAVLLWELFTNDIPFKGVKNSIQLATEIVQNNKRPIFPATCPPKLLKLIKRCWDHDPKVRPTFKNLVLAFETGEFLFPGTNPDIVIAYKNQMIQKERQSTANASFEESKATIDQISKGDIQSIAELIPNLGVLSESTEFVKYLVKMNALNPIFEFMDTHDDSKNLDEFLKFVCSFYGDQKMQSEKHTEILIRLFMRFGSTSTTIFIECLQLIVKHCSHKFTKVELSKLSTFLISNNIKPRILMTEILSIIAERKLFDEDSHFEVIIPNVVINVNSDSTPELLLASLDLISKITEYKSSFVQLNASDSLLFILPLCGHKNAEIATQSFKLILKIISATTPSEIFMNLYINNFENYSKCCDEFSLSHLSICALLMRQTRFYNMFSNNKFAVGSLKNYLHRENPATTIYALKICYAFISNPCCTFTFSYLANDLSKLLSNSNNVISILSAACLTRLLASDSDIMKNVLSDSIADYLNKNISSNDPDIVCSALRLAGSLSSTIIGAEFIESNNIVYCIAKQLQSNNSEIKLFSLMVFAAYSSQIPSSPSLIKSIPIIIEMKDDSKYFKYVNIFLSNITVDPEGAAECVKYLKEILSVFNQDEGIFTTIFRIVTTPEAQEKINDGKIIQEIFDNTKNLWDSPNATRVFKIYDALSTISEGYVILKQNNLCDILKTRLNEIHITSPHRPIFKRIISRLTH